MNYSQILRSQILPKVQTPGQYIGGELNMVKKDLAMIRGRFCLSFPDTYAIGMSCHGIQVLYHLMNRLPDFYCERVFAPMRDMETALREAGLPLGSLETSTPLHQFDAIGFSLQHELGYANVLTILDLGGIPIQSKERTEVDPLVIAGGPCAQNPEPMARFVDAFILGDGEEALPAVNRAWVELRKSEKSRWEKLEILAKTFSWLYVPSCYVAREEKGLLIPYPKKEGIPEKLTQAMISHLDEYPLPEKPIVPNVGAVQDRVAIEIMRGCPWQCRFCQSNPIRRPVRSRQLETVLQNAIEAIQNTGYNELSLLSLSTSDYPWFEELARRLREVMDCQKVSISVPSLRVNKNLAEVGEILSTERRSGLTIAPEAALDDMRKVIGKRVTNEDLLDGCRIAFENRFQRVKLYFMAGLPGERPEDLDGIIKLGKKIGDLGKEVSGRYPTVVISVSNLVPKPQTPLQWHPMATRDYFLQAQRYLKSYRLPRWMQIKYHFVEGSLLEGVLCRGDRRVGEAIEIAWQRGARFDSWNDQFQPEIWWESLKDCGVDVSLYLHEERNPDDPLPWGRIEIFQGNGYLKKEFREAMQQKSELAPSKKRLEVPDFVPRRGGRRE